MSSEAPWQKALVVLEAEAVVLRTETVLRRDWVEARLVVAVDRNPPVAVDHRTTAAEERPRTGWSRTMVESGRSHSSQRRVVRVEVVSPGAWQTDRTGST